LKSQMRAVFAACLILAAACVVTADEERVSFAGHQVLTLHVPAHYVELIMRIANDEGKWGLDFWTDLVPTESGTLWLTDVRVPPEHQVEFKAWLDQHRLKWTVLIPELEEAVQYQLQRADIPITNTAADWFAAYHNYADTMKWMNETCAQYSSICKILYVGNSYQGRPIMAFKISGASETNAPKPQVVYDATIHAREWVAPSTVEYIAYQLMSLYGKDAEVTEMVNKLDYFIVPIYNPDGYQYTWDSNRMWRKNRSPNSGSSCMGTDPCRNTADHWGGAGASTDPCSETFRGKGAASEPEVKAVTEWIKSLGNVKLYTNFHSYSQLYMRPNGWTSALPKDAPIQQQLGQQAVAAIKSKGVTYQEGNWYRILYPSSGTMMDWVYNVANVTLSYAIELRPTPGDGRGFVLPPSEIIPTGNENFAAVRVAAKFVLSHLDQL